MNLRMTSDLVRCSSLTSAFLDEEKALGKFALWKVTNVEYKSISKFDLQFATRTSFSSDDYFGDLFKNMNSGTALTGPYLLFSFLPILFTSIILPQIDFIPRNMITIFSSISLVLPFVYLSVNIIAPDVLVRLLYNNDSGDSDRVKIKQRERIAYHEAGHMLTGYLCGILVLAYDISGDRDASTTIDFAEDSVSQSVEDTFSAKAAHLLVVAMAGVVAETLRFGDSRGGQQVICYVNLILQIGFNIF